MIIRTEHEKNLLYEAGHRLAFILDAVIKKAVDGITEQELDEYTFELITKGGDTPAFLHYRPSGASIPYPSTLCISVNDRVVHGIPKDYKIKAGDIVSLDVGLVRQGTIVDMAKTIPVGNIDVSAKKLIETTEGALYRGIEAARSGAHVGDIGFAINSFVKKSGFAVVCELGGHGVGKKVHEEPFIPNFGKIGEGVTLADGMVLAIEPIVNEGTADIALLPDGYTFKTRDGKRSAHFEHTIIVTPRGGEIVTKA